MKHIAVVVFLLLSATVSFAENEKVILTTQNWAPYQTNESNIIDGFAVAAVSCVLEIMERPFEVQVYPWEKSQELVKEDKAAGFFSASQNANRDKFATLSSPISESSWTWYLLKDSELDPNTTSFVESARVTGIAATNTVAWLKSKNYNITMDNITDTHTLVNALVEKKVDAIFTNSLTMRVALESMHLSPDLFKSYVSTVKPLGVYWSHNFLQRNPDFLEKFNSLISMCR